MTTMASAPAVLNALGTLGLATQVMALQAQIDAFFAPPLSSPGARLGFVFPGAVNGNGSAARPWGSLNEAAIGLGALPATSADGDPVVIVLGKGTYAANTVPFSRPVSLVMEQGARWATGVTTLPAALPARTAVTILTTSWGIQRSPSAVGTAGLPTDPAETGMPTFAFTVATPALYATSYVTYRGAGSLLSGNDAILRAAASVPSGWSLSLDNVNASAGVVATGAVVTARGSALGSGAGGVDADVLFLNDGQIGGAVTIGVNATVVDSDTSFVSAWTGDVSTDGRGQQGFETAGVTPTGAVAFVPGTVLGFRVVTAASPQVVALPGSYNAACNPTITPEVSDASTFWAITATTPTTFTITYGGTAPVAWRCVVQG